jgi:hypothetical protein
MSHDIFSGLIADMLKTKVVKNSDNNLKSVYFSQKSTFQLKIFFIEIS